MNKEKNNYYFPEVKDRNQRFLSDMVINKIMSQQQRGVQFTFDELSPMFLDDKSLVYELNKLLELQVEWNDGVFNAFENVAVVEDMKIASITCTNETLDYLVDTTIFNFN